VTRLKDASYNLSAYFSEYSLMRYRVLVEIEYFIALVELPLPQLKDFDHSLFPTLRSWYENFDETGANRIKEFEKETNHDVKAVEYFIKEKMDSQKLGTHKEFVHFGLTSQDINNTAIPLSLKEAIDKQYLPSLSKVLEALRKSAKEWLDIPMLAKTHGQSATPTRLGKEFMVWVERIDNQLKLLKQIPSTAKFGGATGGLNAHAVAYPNVDWIAFANKFVKGLGLEREQYTTQIGHYDSIGALCDGVKRINTILIDLCRDVWQYISMEYFKQKINPKETGSSAMPHKVNPIDFFENAEGNFGIANAIFEHLSSKLPISRLQRDLTDSTVLRNLGVPFSHTILSLSSLDRGMGKLILNEVSIKKDLEDNWIIVSEAIQTVLRREGVDRPYEKLKDLTRTSERITHETLSRFVDNLQDVSDSVKKELKAITPFTYIGVVPKEEKSS